MAYSTRTPARRSRIEAPVILHDLLAMHGIDRAAFAEDVARENAVRGSFHVLTAAGTSTPTALLRSLPSLMIMCLDAPARVEMKLADRVLLLCHGDGTADIRITGAVPHTLVAAMEDRRFREIASHPLLDKRDYLSRKASLIHFGPTLRVRIDMPSEPLG